MSKENPNEFKIINKNERLKYLNLITDKNKQISDLEAKLAESEKRIELADCIIKQYADKDKNLYLQLAEKEKEVERLREINLDVPIKQMQFHHNQDKISFCIEQLENVKEIFESCWDYEFDIGEVCNKGLFYNKIDNQINVLRNNKDGIH